MNTPPPPRERPMEKLNDREVAFLRGLEHEVQSVMVKLYATGRKRDANGANVELSIIRSIIRKGSAEAPPPPPAGHGSVRSAAEIEGVMAQAYAAEPADPYAEGAVHMYEWLCGEAEERPAV